MAIHAEIVDLDQMFYTSAVQPILVNDFNIVSAEDRERLLKMVYTTYDGDSLALLPSCDCGKTVGAANEGTICPDCKIAVRAVTERPLEAVLWLTTPKHVKRFINPAILTILQKFFKIRTVDMLRWQLDTSFPLPEKPHEEIRRYVELGIPRGLNYFYDNFDAIMEKVLTLRTSKANSVPTRHLMQFLAKYRDRIFCEYLPIPSKLSFIKEITVTSAFADTSIVPAMEAITTISNASFSIMPQSSRTLQSMAAKANFHMADYYEIFKGMFLAGKSGMVRKHMLGGRLHFTFRAVITSNSDNHVYDELVIPWALAVSVLKLHLTSKLMKRGYTPNECTRFLHEYTNRYHPLMDELFKELIAEGPGGSIPVLFNRNDFVTCT